MTRQSTLWLALMAKAKAYAPNWTGLLGYSTQSPPQRPKLLLCGWTETNHRLRSFVCLGARILHDRYLRQAAGDWLQASALLPQSRHQRSLPLPSDRFRQGAYCGLLTQAGRARRLLRLSRT